MATRQRRLKTWSEYLGFLAVRWTAGLLPYRLAGGLGAALGALVFRCTPIRKHVTLDNLRNAFPEVAEPQRRRIAEGAFRNYGRSIFEMFWGWAATEDAIRSKLHLVNPELPAEAIGRGKGVIMLSGHFGSWEFLLASSHFAIQTPMTVIVQEQRNKLIDALVERKRSRFDAHPVSMGRSIREALETLHEKGAVFLLGDQSGSKEALYIPFFGRPAATHRGPAAFALKTGAPLIMQFLIRRSDGTHDVRFEEIPHDDLHGSSEENMIELTRRHSAMLEKYIRANPDHWLWMHKRWKHTAYYESTLTSAQRESGRAPA